MTRYHVEILPPAAKEYHAIPATHRKSVKNAILALEQNPRGRQVKKLKGSEYYRLRSGDWRIIYSISNPRGLVTIIAVERRSSTTY